MLTLILKCESKVNVRTGFANSKVSSGTQFTTWICNFKTYLRRKTKKKKKRWRVGGVGSGQTKKGQGLKSDAL